VSGIVPGGSYICGIELLNSHHTSLRTFPSHALRIDAQDPTEFIFARVIAFVNILENLVNDRGSIFSTKIMVNLIRLSKAERHPSVAIHRS
jgi:hypothetical protein